MVTVELIWSRPAIKAMRPRECRSSFRLARECPSSRSPVCNHWQKPGRPGRGPADPKTAFAFPEPTAQDAKTNNGCGAGRGAAEKEECALTATGPLLSVCPLIAGRRLALS